MSTWHYLAFIAAVFLCVHFGSLNSASTTTAGSTLETFDAYVDNNATGEETGKIDHPYHSISNAIAHLKSGSIKVRAGKDYPESIKITTSIRLVGEPFMTIKPRIVGGNEAIVSVSGSDIVVDGFEITNGSFLKTTHLNDGTDPTGIKVEPGSESITITHNRIKTIGRDYDNKCRCAPDKDCPCAGQAHGINVNSYVAKAIKNVTIADNELFNLHLGRSEALTINGNVSAFLVAHNYIHDVDNIAIDIAGKQDPCESTDDPRCQANTGIVSRNTVTSAYASLNSGHKHFNPGQAATSSGDQVELMGAIYVDGGTRTTLEGNTVSDSATGIDVGSEQGATVEDIVVCNNLVYRNLGPGLKVGNEDNKENSPNLKNITVLNNTFVDNPRSDTTYDNGTIYFGGESGDHFSNVNIANNIFLMTDQSGLHRTHTITNARISGHNAAAFRNNFFYSRQPAFYDSDGQSFADFKKLFHADSERQLNTTELANLFEGLATFDYRLAPNSAAIDAGDQSFLGIICGASSQCLDLFGFSRVIGKIDVGAAEYQK